MTTRVEFGLTREMAEELARIKGATGFTDAEVFRRAFTLLRIHVEAAQQGLPIYRCQKDGYHYPQPRDLIELPFKVKPDA